MKPSECSICYWLTDWCKQAKLDPEKVYFTFNKDKNIINVYSPVPGQLIGPKGIYFNYAEVELCVLFNAYKQKPAKINIVEVTKANFWVNYNPVPEDF